MDPPTTFRNLEGGSWGLASRLSGMIWLLLLVTLLALMAHFAARQTRLNLVPDQAGVPRRPARLDSRPRHPA